MQPSAKTRTQPASPRKRNMRPEFAPGEQIFKSNFAAGDCDLLSASALEGRRGCARECDEILRRPPASDRCG